MLTVRFILLIFIFQYGNIPYRTFVSIATHVYQYCDEYVRIFQYESSQLLTVIYECESTIKKMKRTIRTVRYRSVTKIRT